LLVRKACVVARPARVGQPGAFLLGLFYLEKGRGESKYLGCRRACILVTEILFSGILNFQKIKDTMLASLC